MECEFCGATLPEDSYICPDCGANNTPATSLESRGDSAEETIEIIPAELDPEELDLEEQYDEEEQLAPAVTKMKLTALVSGCIAVLAVLAVVLFFGMRGSFSADGEGWKMPSITLFRKNNIAKKDSYTVQDSVAQQKGSDVVATLGGAQLTKGQLQIYYQMELISFVNEYGYFLSYLGIDFSAPLDQQPCTLVEDRTWQQFFLERALNTWQQNQILALEAKANHFQLDADTQDYLDMLASSMEILATQNGFNTADEMIQAEFGSNTTLKDWLEYMDISVNGYQYYLQLCQAIPNLSDEQLAEYYRDNQEALEAQGILQDSGYTVDVRHILILPDGATVETIRTETFSEEAWAIAETRAQEILDLWYAGEATEESFAALAHEHSADSGSNTAGGLYTGVTVGSMVAAFENWCFDAQREKGHVGIVKTELGYHVMYFSARGEDLWLTYTRQAYQSQQQTAILEAAMENYEAKVTYKKIALVNINLM